MTGKVGVITGGASGIGRATALAFAREGARVVIGDIDIAGAENTVATIKDLGGKADCLRVDVAKSADVQALVMKAIGQYGGLDFAFNNAGLVGSVAGIVETTEEDWNHVVATNLTGVWLCMKYELSDPGIRRQFLRRRNRHQLLLPKYSIQGPAGWALHDAFDRPVQPVHRPPVTSGAARFSVSRPTARTPSCIHPSRARPESVVSY
ncbi:MAG TPA: SDR family NAD(P)-dependent oxidoreductase [Candidatus Udaeobacter sp.]|nr:SDR family NAD(P)-dependent oxidoreductase [Candidatus Udaeobacter sp.]